MKYETDIELKISVFDPVLPIRELESIFGVEAEVRSKKDGTSSKLGFGEHRKCANFVVVSRTRMAPEFALMKGAELLKEADVAATIPDSKIWLVLALYDDAFVELDFETAEWNKINEALPQRGGISIQNRSF